MALASPLDIPLAMQCFTIIVLNAMIMLLTMFPIAVALAIEYFYFILGEIIISYVLLNILLFMCILLLPTNFLLSLLMLSTLAFLSAIN